MMEIVSMLVMVIRKGPSRCRCADKFVMSFQLFQKGGLDSSTESHRLLMIRILPNAACRSMAKPIGLMKGNTTPPLWCGCSLAQI